MFLKALATHVKNNFECDEKYLLNSMYVKGLIFWGDHSWGSTACFINSFLNISHMQIPL